MQVLVWRIENENQSGPYGQCYFGPSHNDQTTHPSPYRDEALEPEPTGQYGKYLAINHSEYCGAASLRQLCEWFEGHGKRLEDKGFKIVALSVPHWSVRVGRRQVVFRRASAQLIHTMNPTQFITSTSKIEED